MTPEAPFVELSLDRGDGDDDLLPDLVALREHGPVVRVRQGSGHAWVVSDPDLVRAVLTDPRFSKEGRHAPPWFVDESGLIGSAETAAASDIVTSEGEEHARLRKLHLLAFSPARIRAWSATVEAITGRLLDAVQSAGGQEPVDLVAGLAYPLPLEIICTLLGLPADTRPVLRGASEKIFYGGDASVRDEGRELLYRTVAEVIDRHPHRLATGLITDLLALTRSDPPQATLTEVKAWVPSLVLPGHESTASLISAALYELLAGPTHLGATPEFVEAVVEEALRRHPPFPLATWRFAAQHCTLAGIDVPVGTPVLVNLAAANHDPRVHPRPERFLPDRPVIDHVTFGLGSHYCVGAGLARLEARTALKAFLRRFPEARLAEPPAAARWQTDLLSRRLIALPVLLTPG
ncbi:cytochrome P450 [Kutzneria viridogrisea]|uniref:Cytochrome P450 n=2 Tax=Kutzneria TaxID=43356 RepID=W5WF41_9PSEU|nr:cytochrome P450 [Kutzneria albida]AHH96779.1 hypothetical protein KALB_3412 [Kutzneria albida DSM 43870]MBA8928002.1 13-deoxydaunorubicin hydroxylase [Kutzneria viridogrisea]